MSRKAFTLAELAVAFFLGVLVLGVLVTLFVNFRRSAENPIATMSMEQSTLSLINWLRHDLDETNLQSVRTISGVGSATVRSGLVMESPRDDNGNLVPFVNGTAVWKRYIYYTVQGIRPQPPTLPSSLAVGGITVNPMVGELDYDEDSSDSNLGVEPRPPKSYANGCPNPDPKRHRVLARNILMDSNANNPASLGFLGYYNDPSNGAVNLTDTQLGEPVTVAISLMDLSSRTGQPTVRRLLIQVRPRN